MGLLSLDTLKLRIKLAVGTERDKICAKKIIPLLENHHFLLCTLLLFNAAANEALPIFLDAIVPAWAAVIIAVTLVLLCGEILPTAIFTGPRQLEIAAGFSGLVYFLQIIFYPIAKPMALLLDRFLGTDDVDDRLGRDEISAMLQIISEDQIHSQKHPDFRSGSQADNPSRRYSYQPERDSEEGNVQSRSDEQPLSADEVKVITGVLALAKKTIRDVFIPLDKVDMLSADNSLDGETVAAIESVGHSRLPVFRGEDRTDIAGYLLVKKLISINPNSRVPLSSVPLNNPLVVGANQRLLDVLTLFQRGESHLALVSEQPQQLHLHMRQQRMGETSAAPPESCRPLGILTLEDVIEEMLQSEIYDEEDIALGDPSRASANLRELSVRASVSDMHPQEEAPASAVITALLGAGGALSMWGRGRASPPAGPNPSPLKTRPSAGSLSPLTGRRRSCSFGDVANEPPKTPPSREDPGRRGVRTKQLPWTRKELSSLRSVLLQEGALSGPATGKLTPFVVAKYSGRGRDRTFADTSQGKASPPAASAGLKTSSADVEADQSNKLPPSSGVGDEEGEERADLRRPLL